MESLLKFLSEYLVEKYSNEDVLFHVLEYMKNRIPFERVGCYLLNTNEKTLSSFMEYGFNDDISTYSYKIKNVTPAEDYDRVRRDGFDVISNCNFEEPIYFFEEFPYKIGSYMIFVFHNPEDHSMRHIFGCFSSEDNMFTQEHIDAMNSIRPYLEKILCELYVDTKKPLVYLASVGQLPSTYEEQLRACPGMRDVVERIDVVRQFDFTVCISGATGTGKELVAETIHTLSPRRQKPFVRVNCGAIPETLIESEFFGYEKGAFTGANHTRIGYFEKANGGTIYFDEIGELSLYAQTRLLRVLENKEIQRVGSVKNIKLDIRIISATHRNLWEMVQKGTFREDLYYRLNIFPIHITPLSQRKKDIHILLDYYYKVTAMKMKLQNVPIITDKTLMLLTEYPWPGNVRQLKASIERGMAEALVTRKNEIDFKFLPEIAMAQFSTRPLTQEEIITALTLSNGKVQGQNGAAALLNIHPATLRSRMKVLNIDYSKKKNAK